MIPPGNHASAKLVDELDQGLAFVDCLTIDAQGLSTDQYNNDFNQICTNPIVKTFPDLSTEEIDKGRYVEFNFGTLTNNNDSDAILTIRYRAVILDSDNNMIDEIRNNKAEFYYGAEYIEPSSVSTTIIEPQLEIIKTADTNIASPGDNITFTLTIQHTNISNSDAFDVVVKDQLPNSLEFIGGLNCSAGIQPADVECSYDAQTQTIQAEWSTFSLQGGEGVIEFIVRPSANFIGGNISNTANVTWTSLPGPVPGPLSVHSPLLSHERFYDPTSLIDIYEDSDMLTLGFASSLPDTGFAAGVITRLPQRSFNNYYAKYEQLWLEIPKLQIFVPIIGIPQTGNSWDVRWLRYEARYLNGTAFPTWEGNTVLTGHKYLADGQPGPFVNLETLKWGDTIIIYHLGMKYAYEIRNVGKIEPDDFSIIEHKDYDWVSCLPVRDMMRKTNHIGGVGRFKLC